MIICEVNKNHLNVRTKELLTAGSQNVNTVEFRFNAAWDGLAKTATFKTSKKTTSVLLGTNTTEIPWEVLADAGEILAVGVFGVSGETLVLPTVWGILGKVMDAAHLGDEEKEPTPDVYQKILDELNALERPTWDSVQNKPFSTLGGGLSVDKNGVLSAEGGSGSDNAVQYVAQELTDEQKAQARENIGAGTSSFSGSYNDLTSKPTIPTQVTIDSTLKQSGQAADAKAVGDALQHFTPTEALNSEFREIELTFATKLDKNQGTTNAGKILGVGEDGIVVPQDKPTYTLTDADKTAVADAVVADGIAATLVNMPSGGGGGETWVKLVDTSLAEAVESVTYTFDNCKRIKALIAPTIANGEFVSGWIRITINNVAYPSFNGKVNFYEGIDFEIDSEYPPYVQGEINAITNTTIYGIVSGKHAASLENIAPNGVTEFGCQTAALLKAGTKIEIWGVKS